MCLFQISTAQCLSMLNLVVGSDQSIRMYQPNCSVYHSPWDAHYTPITCAFGNNTDRGIQRWLRFCHLLLQACLINVWIPPSHYLQCQETMQTAWHSAIHWCWVPVGWNWTNSKSCIGSPAREAMALPSPGTHDRAGAELRWMAPMFGKLKTRGDGSRSWGTKRDHKINRGFNSEP